MQTLAASWTNNAVNRSRGTAATLHFQLEPHDAVTAAVRFLKTMARFPQPSGTKGSQFWLQNLAGSANTLLTDRITSAIKTDPASFVWLSPLPTDDFAEYRDDDFVTCLGLELKKPLKDFWPRNGPQWDGLVGSGQTIGLIEAKSHLDELASPRCGAGHKSFARISRSMLETQTYIAGSPKIEWTGTGYQYANRLAHLYFLRHLNQVDAHMIFLYFANDPTVRNPVSESQWHGAIRFMDVLLGIRRNKLTPFIHHIVVDVSTTETNNAMHRSRGSAAS